MHTFLSRQFVVLVTKFVSLNGELEKAVDCRKLKRRLNLRNMIYRNITT